MTIEQLRKKFREVFPEFNNIDDYRIDYYLRYSLIIFDKNIDGVLFLTAHNLSIMQSTNINNNEHEHGNSSTTLRAISSMSVEDKKIVYEKNYKKDEDSSYSTTPYGVMFLQIKNKYDVNNFCVMISDE